MSAGDAVLLAAVLGGLTGVGALTLEVRREAVGGLFLVSLAEPFVMLVAALSRNGGCCGVGG